MIRLLTAELHRLGARWIAQAAVVVGILVVGLAGFTAVQDLRPPSAAQVAQNEADYQAAVASWRTEGPATIRECQAGNRAAVAAGQPTMDCTDLAPRREQYVAGPRVVSSLTGSTPLYVCLVVGLLSIIVATSVVGTEFSSGSLSAWLLVEPRRLRVYAAKLTASALYAALLGSVGLALVLVAWWVAGRMEHATFDLTTHDQVVLAARSGRMLLLVTAAAAAAAGLTFLVRSTAGAFIAVVALVGGTTYVFGEHRTGRLSLGDNITAWVNGQGTYYWSTACGTQGGCQQHVGTISCQQGGLYLFAMCLLAILLGAFAFRRRDVP